MRITTSLNAKLDTVAAIKSDSELTRQAQYQSSVRNVAREAALPLI
jgi:hypothetical protein